MAAAHLSWTDWSVDPTVVLGVLALVGVYVTATRRGLLRGDDDVSPWLPRPSWRPVLFATGILVGYVALQSPIDRGGDRYLFVLHMIQHVLLMMVAPPLVLLGFCGGRGLPSPAGRWWEAAGRGVSRPWPATLLFSAVLLVWHIPSLYDSTLTSEPIHVVEHLTFVAVGLIFWWPVVDPIRRRTGGPTAGPVGGPVGSFAKIAMLVASGIPPTILGLLFSISPRVFYDYYARAPRLWGLSAQTDQQLAGVVMFGIGNLIYFVAISIIFVRLFGDVADEPEGGAHRVHGGVP